eukprot:COSAG02_NODE_3146_length_7287_cov_3.402615_5_plen_92_part_00
MHIPQPAKHHAQLSMLGNSSTTSKTALWGQASGLVDEPNSAGAGPARSFSRLRTNDLLLTKLGAGVTGVEQDQDGTLKVAVGSGHYDLLLE